MCGWLGLVVGALASGLAFAAPPASFREYIYSDTLFTGAGQFLVGKVGFTLIFR